MNFKKLFIARKAGSRLFHSVVVDKIKVGNQKMVIKRVKTLLHDQLLKIKLITGKYPQKNQWLGEARERMVVKESIINILDRYSICRVCLFKVTTNSSIQNL